MSENIFFKSKIIGVGSYLPERIVTNDELSKNIDTDDKWISERTGIKERRIADDSETTSSLGIEAAKKAIDNAGISKDDIDLIILATATPDNTFPATATSIQAGLGIKSGYAYDVQAVCSGFVFALEIADNSLKLGKSKNALVIGSETFSRILDWKDRSTCVLFGDGAGAVVLQSADSNSSRGILSNHLHSDGNYKDMLYVDGGPSTSNNVGFLRMDGQGVFKHAVKNISGSILEALKQNNITIDDIDLFIPHQANSRILDAVAKKVGLKSEKIIVTVDKHANTSAASIPLALNEAVELGKVNEGDIILLAAMGGGFTWGSSLIRW
jgi:3-oxoacyl-[acyl-carrier-protein] synthase-3